MTYGDLQSTFSLNLNVSDVDRWIILFGIKTKLESSPFQRIRTNGSLYLHVSLTKSGFLPGPRKGDSWTELYTYRKTKRLNFYEQADEEHFSQVPSYWTVNLVDDLEIRIWSNENELIVTR